VPQVPGSAQFPDSAADHHLLHRLVLQGRVRPLRSAGYPPHTRTRCGVAAIGSRARNWPAASAGIGSADIYFFAPV
jgi:hypothetical protein